MDVTGRGGVVLRSPPGRHSPCGRPGAEGQQAARPREPASPGTPVHAPETSSQAEAVRHVLPSRASTTALRPGVSSARGWGGSSALGAPLPWGLTPVAEQAARSAHMARRAQQERKGRGRGWGAAGSRAHRAPGGGLPSVRTDEEGAVSLLVWEGQKERVWTPWARQPAHAGQAPPQEQTLPGASCVSAWPPSKGPGRPARLQALRVVPIRPPRPLADRSCPRAGGASRVCSIRCQFLLWP